MDSIGNNEVKKWCGNEIKALYRVPHLTSENRDKNLKSHLLRETKNKI